jgi:hypothetical protein
MQIVSGQTSQLVVAGDSGSDGKSEALTGKWNPPPVVKVQEGPKLPSSVSANERQRLGARRSCP